MFYQRLLFSNLFLLSVIDATNHEFASQRIIPILNKKLINENANIDSSREEQLE